MMNIKFQSHSEAADQCYILLRGAAAYFTRISEAEITSLLPADSPSTELISDVFSRSNKAKSGKETLVLQSNELVGVLEAGQQRYLTFVFDCAVVFLLEDSCEIEDGDRDMWLKEEIEFSNSIKDGVIKDCGGNPEKEEEIVQYFERTKPAVMRRIV